ncbi:HupE/UreJ family protein [Novosphingobium sp. AAP83]|uniref:HupE/UreJ family protein n=1 Tax=Novosphingobium sp. AAP83 TaxID=1523425 RepID=UPI000B022D94|nr:HupE/UreJ family protein [Novosphingobium sp. AAP83]
MRHLSGVLAIIMALALVLLGAGRAEAHEVRPVYLDIKETAAGRYDVIWRVPVTNGMAPPVSPRFAAGCKVSGGLPWVAGSSAVSRMVVTCAEGLAATTITLDGLSHTMIDGLVRIQFASGEVATRLVRPANPAFTVPGANGPLDVIRIYAGLGTEHILAGYDHLLFVLGMVLYVKRSRAVLLSISSFTLAHSITLSMAALGVIAVPSALAEALIALSILMLAVELVRSAASPDGATGLRPAVLAFVFGLLHGLGFAGALAAIGLPAHEIPLSLLGFNIGVELGQIAFVIVILAIGRVTRALGPQLRQRAYRVCTYAIGSLAAFWTIERVMAF